MGTGRLLFVLAGIAALTLSLVSAAPTATAPQGELLIAGLPASQGGGLGIDVTFSDNAPAPARMTLYVPKGYALGTSAAPGTKVGTASAIYTSDLNTGGAFTTGTLKTGDPSTLPSDPAAQACAPGSHAAVWLATFKVDGQPTTVRFYVDPTAGASDASLGAYRLVACFASPYRPVELGGSPNGMHFDDLDLVVSQKSGSVLKNPRKGTFVWRLFVTPYFDNGGEANSAAAFEARARVLIPHVLTLRASYRLKTKTLRLTGTLTALGKARRGVRVTILGGSPKADVLSYWGSAVTHAKGAYSFSKGIRPQAKARKLVILTFVTVVRGSCSGPSVAPAGCVEENLSPPADGLVHVTIPKRH
jgi:hypothetical protein